ncbi:MAG: alpha/beta hydrolase, partial [Chloroflexota bacterium]|nr:alpha/beta hydrolase [Chloroflexota bacterium]
TARHLTVGAGCVVVSIDYRLAPETKFPGPAEDCYAATSWVFENASGLGIFGDRIAVGGDSSGGNLAAAVCLMIKDRGGPNLAMQLLVYPVTDWSFQTDSYVDNAEGYQLTKDTMIWYWDQYVSHDGDAQDPYAAPLKAPDLSGLPSALVITAEFDPLRDEGEAYANRLKDAGVPTSCTRYPGMIHGFFGMSAALDKGKDAISEASAALMASFTN